jgi:ribosomal protein L11 methyltransferase
MTWTSFIVHSDDLHVELISDFFIELGAISVSIQDSNLNQKNEELIFGEPHNGPQQFWQDNQIQALFDQSSDKEKIKAKLKDKFKSLKINIIVSLVSNQDWIKLTQSQFSPISIKNKLWIIPSWHDIIDDKAINLILDPGLAFGTGAHPTTHLCIEWLIENIQHNYDVLDYGCGSGILGIAAKKLGAKKVIGVDIDPQAIQSSQNNANLNSTKIEWLNTDKPLNYRADLIVANILSSSLSVLAPALARHCKTGGKIALSGILKSQESMIKEIYTEWFDFEPSLFKNDWVCISGIRR